METKTARRELFPRSEDHVIAGVAHGLGDYLGVQTGVVRAGFVLMGLGGGVGVVVYAAAYLMSSRPNGDHARYPATSRHALGFLAISLGVMVAGLDMFLDNIGAIASLRAGWLATIATALVLSLVFGPWLLRLVKQVSEERSDRIRSEERADISAHLHDSVLNTLALIQRLEAKPKW